MKFETKKDAKAFGTKILKVLKGTGWKMRIWENIGWHVTWHLGRVRLLANNGRNGPRFWCLVSDDDEGIGGSMLWTIHTEYKDPNTAVKKHLKHAIGVASAVFAGLLKTRSAIEKE